MRAFGTAITGRRHLDLGIGCEDAFQIAYSADQTWVAAVLCDGCGSVPHASTGSSFISNYLANSLLELSTRIDREGPGEWVIDAAVIRIAHLREEMRVNLKGPISDYAATVIAALVSKRGGFLLHIGDGIATALTPKEDGTKSLATSCQSDPENGEFINETFYPTGLDWVRHVRIIPVSDPSLIVLCTDGAQELLYHANTPKPETISALIDCTASAAPDLDHGLRELLQACDNPRASGDDLGCVVIFNPDNQTMGYSPAIAAPAPSSPQPDISPAITPRRYFPKLSVDPLQPTGTQQTSGRGKSAFLTTPAIRTIAKFVAFVLVLLMFIAGVWKGVVLIRDFIHAPISSPCNDPMACNKAETPIHLIPVIGCSILPQQRHYTPINS